MEISKSSNCSGTVTVTVDASFIGSGDTKDEAKTDLMGKIAASADQTCGRGSCANGTCKARVPESEMTNTRYAVVARDTKPWLAYLTDDNITTNVTAKCFCLSDVV